MNRIGSIYSLRCLVNDKEYVGQTVRAPEVRWAEHVYAAFVTKSKKPLYTAMRKYGLENFIAEVIWTGPEAQLNVAERRFVRQRKTFIDGGWGYNLTTGGGTFKLSKRSIQKIRKSLRAYFAANPQAARRLGDFTKRSCAEDPSFGQAISRRLEKFWDGNDAARSRMSRTKIRQYKSDQTLRIKVSEAAVAQWSSVEARAEKSTSMARSWEHREGNDRRVSAKGRKRMSDAQWKRFSDPTECKKISEGQLKRYEDPAAHAKSSEAQYRRFAERPMSSATCRKIGKKTVAAWKDPVLGAKMRAVAKKALDAYWVRYRIEHGLPPKESTRVAPIPK